MATQHMSFLLVFVANMAPVMLLKMGDFIARAILAGLAFDAKLVNNNFLFSFISIATSQAKRFG